MRSLISVYLKNEGLEVRQAPNGKTALQILEKYPVDLALIDVMMPEMDGITLCMKIRESNHIPIIMVSAKDADMDKVMGLTAGADDYLSKPFNPVELIARVRAQLRRSKEFNQGVHCEILEKDGLALHLDTHRLTLEGEEVVLTPKEFAILELLWKNRGIVFSTDRIYDRIWQEQEYDADNIIMVHIRNLRKKIEKDPKNPRFIKTVWGVGYKFNG